MKYAIRVFTFLIFLAGCIALIYLSTENSRLAVEVNRLEAELGSMSIDHPDQVYIAEIAAPDVPPEVAPHLARIWQFRCYLPPGYDFVNMNGGGRVTDEGLYLSGGYGSSWGSPPPTAIHCLLTFSFQHKDKNLRAFYSFNGASGTNSWHSLKPDRLDAMVFRKLVSSKQGPRSFRQDTILPLLKAFDPTTAEDKQVAGRTLTTYEGGHFVLCPKSRENVVYQLRNGETPSDFDSKWLAEPVIEEAVNDE